MTTGKGPECVRSADISRHRSFPGSWWLCWLPAGLCIRLFTSWSTRPTRPNTRTSTCQPTVSHSRAIVLHLPWPTTSVSSARISNSLLKLIRALLVTRRICSVRPTAIRPIILRRMSESVPQEVHRPLCSRRLFCISSPLRSISCPTFVGYSDILL